MASTAVPLHDTRHGFCLRVVLYCVEQGCDDENLQRTSKAVHQRTRVRQYPHEPKTYLAIQRGRVRHNTLFQRLQLVNVRRSHVHTLVV